MGALLAALILLITASAFLERVQNGDLVQNVLTTAVYLAALFAISARRGAFVLALSLIVPAILSKWLGHFRPGLLPEWLYILLGLTGMTFITVELLRFILRAPRVDSEVLCAGISGYLMLAILWAAAYMFIAQVAPGAFAFNTEGGGDRMDAFTAVYFSFGVLGTVGFGDVVPVTRAARLVAVFEATTGMFYVTVLIARLVGLYTPARPGAGEM
jgi:hypothetical protein